MVLLKVEEMEQVALVAGLRMVELKELELVPVGLMVSQFVKEGLVLF